MAVKKNVVTIKGVKDGLVFLMNDQCAFEDLIAELKHKLEKTHHQFLAGPLVQVTIQFGERKLSEIQKNIIAEIIKNHGNLVIRSMETKEEKEKSRSNLKVIKGIVRSGQTVSHEGNMLFVGDVNPGGIITATGDIWIMGSLRGTAHAGAKGNMEATIAASYLRPTQLRIANVISRPPEEWGVQQSYMEFAYLNNGTMEIDKMVYLHKIRPQSMQFKEE
ncbi:septum site-determining protein MinC [Longirhabdus pacifica]|uniref:septum site-determining protein MinC n=1 Tax=Longirhabdus pacifica TaxID=2305227 RepID=UPI001008923C|nr:septum site-determining protein MinC [Longirhabdus pacifica]